MEAKQKLNENAKYETAEIVLEILNCLKEYTDEKNTLTAGQLVKLINENRDEEDGLRSMESVKKILISILSSNNLNPPYKEGEYTPEYYRDYKVLYDGFDKHEEENPVDINRTKECIRNNKRNIKTRQKQLKNNHLSEREVKQIQEEIEYLEKANAYEEECVGKGKAPAIRGLQYRHDFDYNDMDMLLSAIYDSPVISLENKERLAEKMLKQSSKSYRDTRKINRNATVIDSSCLNYDLIGENLMVIQQAIAAEKRIQFYFNALKFAAADGKEPEMGAKPYLTPTVDGKNKKVNTVLPLQILRNSNRYYLIGIPGYSKKVYAYRMDLMSDTVIFEEHEIVPGEVRKAILEGLHEEWNEKRYIKEHFNMFYGEERMKNIQLKVDKKKMIYAYDLFGEDCKYICSCPEDKNYAIISIGERSVDAMVQMAMQYSSVIQIYQPQALKERVKNRMIELGRQYGWEFEQKHE